MILEQFRLNRHTQSEELIKDQRRKAIVAMSNYYVFLVKDSYLKNKSVYDESRVEEE